MSSFIFTPARAGFHVWTGSVNGLWSNTNNWSSGVAPVISETPPVEIEFPSGPTRTSVTNDIYNFEFGPLQVDSIIVTGNNYHIYGKGNGTNIGFTGNPAPFFGINLDNFYCTGTNITFDVGLNLILANTNTITNQPGSTLFMGAALTGTGGWTYQGLGTMYFDGTNGNSSSGNCAVVSGEVVLDTVNGHYFGNFASAISSPLQIGTANTSVPALVLEDGASDQFEFSYYGTNTEPGYPPVSIEPSGTFQIAGASVTSWTSGYETIGALTMTGGLISLTGLVQSGPGGTGTNYGFLEVNGPITVHAAETTSQINGAGLVSDPTYFQSAGIGLGYPTNTIEVDDGAFLIMTTPLTSTYFLEELPNPIYEENNLFKTGAGTLWTMGTDTYQGNTFIQEGLWIADGNTPFGLSYNAESAGYPDEDPQFGPAENQVVVASGAQIYIYDGFSNNVPLVINGFGINQTGGAVNVVAGAAQFTAGCTVATQSSIVVSDGSSISFDNYDQEYGDTPALSGSATFHKQGAGIMNLTMSAAMHYAYSNVFNGNCLVEEGTLDLDGQSDSPLIMGPVTISTNGSSSGANVDLGASQQIGTNLPVTINDNGELYLGGNTQNVGPLALNGGFIELGTLILLSNVTAETTLSSPGITFGSVSLAGTNRTFTIATNCTLPILSAISDGGNNAGIIKAGPGTLSLNDPNTYGGVTQVNAGILDVNNNTALGSAAGATIVAAGAEIDLAGGISVGAEPLTLTGSGTDGHGVLKAAAGNYWAGPITLESLCVISTGGQLTLSGPISGPGGLQEDFNTGTLILSNSQPNTYAGQTIVNAGVLELAAVNMTAVPGPLTVNPYSSPAVFTNTVRWLAGNNQVSGSALITLNTNTLMDMNNFGDTIGSLSGSGALNLRAGSLSIGGNNASTVFSGVITGVSGSSLFKIGSGTLTLSGSSAGTYVGPTLVPAGEVVVTGTVTPSSFILEGGTVAGDGTIGPILQSGGSGFVIPGDPGVLNSGNLSLTSASTFAAAINGPATGSNNSELIVTGTVTLGNAGLLLTASVAGATNTQFTIIKNDGTAAVSGTFAGLAEGATITAGNGAKFKITYKGGAGKDVVLTEISQPPQPKFNSIVELAGGSIQLTGMGTNGLLYTLLANTNLATTNWIPIGTVTAGPTGIFQFIDTNAVSTYRQRFYILATP